MADVDQLYQDYVERSKEWDKLGITPRIVRVNVFPLFVLLALILLVMLLRATAWQLVTGVLLRVKRVLCCYVRAPRVPGSDRGWVGGGQGGAGQVQARRKAGRG